MDLPPQLRDCIDGHRDVASAYADGAYARTRCHEASVAFTDRCRKQGLQAQTWPAWADELGFAERIPTPWLRDDSHCVTAVWVGDQIFTVDWTAAQYGHTAFPLVRHVDTLPKKNPWLLTREEGEAMLAQIRKIYGS